MINYHLFQAYNKDSGSFLLVLLKKFLAQSMFNSIAAGSKYNFRN